MSIETTEFIQVEFLAEIFAIIYKFKIVLIYFKIQNWRCHLQTSVTNSFKNSLDIYIENVIRFF